MFSITMAPGTWATTGRILIEEVNEAFALFFVIYIGAVSFSVIRIISALFLRQTLQIAAGDENSMMSYKMKQQRKYSDAVQRLFVEADISGDGRVSLEEFQTLLLDPIAQ